MTGKENVSKMSPGKCGPFSCPKLLIMETHFFCKFLVQMQIHDILLRVWKKTIAKMQ